MFLAAHPPGEQPEKQTTPTHRREALVGTGQGKAVAGPLLPSTPFRQASATGTYDHGSGTGCVFSSLAVACLGAAGGAGHLGWEQHAEVVPR